MFDFIHFPFKTIRFYTPYSIEYFTDIILQYRDIYYSDLIMNPLTVFPLN